MISDTIFDLYFKKKQIKHIEETIEGHNENEWPSDLFDQIIKLNDEFYIILDKTSSIEEICKQLNLFEKQEGSA